MVEATINTKNNISKPALPPESAQVIRQKYEESKLELKGLLSRKKQVDQNLINLEHAIYLFEGSYLEDTQQNGNIIRGFEGYLSNRQDRKRPNKFTELDRLFSLSSSTYQRAVAQKEERDQESSQDDTPSAFTMRKEKKRRLKLASSSSSSSLGGGIMHPTTKKKKRFEDDGSSVISYED